MQPMVFRVREATMIRIQQLVLDELRFDLSLPRDRLRVKFVNGYVILSGEVDWPHQKSCAEADALRVPGVSVVVNDIAIRRNAAPSHA